MLRFSCRNHLVFHAVRVRTRTAPGSARSVPRASLRAGRGRFIGSSRLQWRIACPVLCLRYSVSGLSCRYSLHVFIYHSWLIRQSTGRLSAAGYFCVGTACLRSLLVPAQSASSFVAVGTAHSVSTLLHLVCRLNSCMNASWQYAPPSFRRQHAYIGAPSPSSLLHTVRLAASFVSFMPFSRCCLTAICSRSN